MRVALSILVASLALAGCGKSSDAPNAARNANVAKDANAGIWSAEELLVVEGLQTPESVLVDEQTAAAYVSNIVPSAEGPWADDGNAFISLLKPSGKMDTLKWRASTPQAPLNAPKGLCLLKGDLYAADNSRVACFSEGGGFRQIAVPGAKMLNDMADDGADAYVSDTATGRIWRLGKPPKVVAEVPSANGITFHRGRMLAVSWEQHEVYEVDPEGGKPPKPLGLAKNFRNLDGIEVLDDGTILVSDFTANKVYAISPDRKTVRVLIEVRTPADIGLARRAGLLYVPSFDGNKVFVYRLARK
jgi:hypothetical protein